MSDKFSREDIIRIYQETLDAIKGQKGQPQQSPIAQLLQVAKSQARPGLTEAQNTQVGQ